MTSYHGYTPSYDYTHMYDMKDLNTPTVNIYTKKNSVMDFIQTHPKLRLFAYIARLAQMEGVLNDAQLNSTLFVTLDSNLDQAIVGNMNILTARKIVQYSMLPRAMDMNLLRSDRMMQLYTKTGMPVLIVNEYDKVFVNNTTITQSDIMCSNGIIHVLSDILVPV